MATKQKTFDCVEMKRQAQEDILADWELHKNEYSSYSDYLEASLQESEWTRKTWERLQKQTSPTAL